MDRVVSELSYDEDILDRRIVFEMIGERLDPADFPDETSEDEENNEDSIITPSPTSNLLARTSV